MKPLPVNRLFRRVRAPEITGHPHTSPHWDMMQMPDGEIRHYGARIHTLPDGSHDYDFIVQKSFDYGMSWSEFPVETRTPGATVRSPWSGDYLTLRCQDGVDYFHINFSDDRYHPILKECKEKGIWFFRSRNGADGDYAARRILDEPFHLQRQPLPLRSRKRWLCTGEQRLDDGFIHPIVLLSDDDGETWRKLVLPYPPLHKQEWPHRGSRWLQPGVEPVVAEYPDGRLHMLLRTSQDFHYQCFSTDGGETWTLPEPSPFYSVATMPNLLALRDGRMLAVWNNSTPLPEVDHALQNVGKETAEGVWEDVFTNRDVLHAAISEDNGKSWIGFREIALNPTRNDADFRTGHGGVYSSWDRSVHQNQALELPENKVLVAFGQHAPMESFVLFDLDWLYETGRKDDFRCGLDHWSVHQYFKSHSGSSHYNGHCAWNRRAGATLVPAPDGGPSEFLQVARHPDCRVVDEREGAVWNFPAARRGTVTLKLYLGRGSRGMRITLCDRWLNPTDPVVAQISPFSLELDPVGRVNGVPMLPVGEVAELVIEYDQEREEIEFSSGTNRGRGVIHRKVPGMVSYLHLQTLAESADPVGVLIGSVEMQAKG